MMWWTVLLLTLIHLDNVRSCPPQEDITPCTCYGKLSTLHGHCAGVNSLDQFQSSVRGFQGSSLLTFTLESSSFDYIPYDIFRNVTIRHLVISKSNVSRIGNLGDPQFEGLEDSLESLKVSDTFGKDNTFSYVSLNHLKKLEVLELHNCYMEVVHNEWFKNGPSSLKVVRFVKGQVRYVGFRSLGVLHQLRVVDLSENAIEHMTRTALPDPALHLHEINLERNKLVSLPDDFFTQMPSLKTVNLELNKFSTIDEKIWKPVWNGLQSLNIDYNPMICDAKIKWIFEKQNLEDTLTATCYKPYKLMDRDLHSLELDELK